MLDRSHSAKLVTNASANSLAPCDTGDISRAEICAGNPQATMIIIAMSNLNNWLLELSHQFETALTYVTTQAPGMPNKFNPSKPLVNAPKQVLVSPMLLLIVMSFDRTLA